MIALPVAAEVPLRDSSSRAQAESMLSSRLPVWQQKLGLADWNVTVLITPRAQLKPGTLGGIRWDKKKKTAVMSVPDPAEYTVPVDEMLQDLEFTLVHELIHLELASLPRSEASRRTEELAVNNLTRALLGLNTPK
jgi:hypothetical protein